MPQSRKNSAGRRASDQRGSLDEDHLYGGLSGPGGIGGYSGLSPDFIPGSGSREEGNEKKNRHVQPRQEKPSWFSFQQHGGSHLGPMMIPNMRRAQDPEPQKPQKPRKIDPVTQTIPKPQAAFVAKSRKEFEGHDDELSGSEDEKGESESRRNWNRAKRAQEQSSRSRNQSWSNWVKYRIWRA